MIDMTPLEENASQKRKEELIAKLFNDFYHFDESDLQELVGLINKEEDYQALKHITKRFFDLNEGLIKNHPEPATGMIGRLNWRSFHKREKNYYKKIMEGGQIQKIKPLSRRETLGLNTPTLTRKLLTGCGSTGNLIFLQYCLWG